MKFVQLATAFVHFAASLYYVNCAWLNKGHQHEITSVHLRGISRSNPDGSFSFPKYLVKECNDACRIAGARTEMECEKQCSVNPKLRALPCFPPACITQPGCPPGVCSPADCGPDIMCILFCGNLSIKVYAALD